MALTFKKLGLTGSVTTEDTAAVPSAQQLIVTPKPTIILPKPMLARPITPAPKPGGLSIKGFTAATKVKNPGYITLGFGEEGSGKSRMGLRMPWPMGVICMDIKTIPLIKKEIAESGLDGDQILVSENLSRLEDVSSIKTVVASREELKDDKELQASMKVFREHVEEVKQLIFLLAKDKHIRSCMIDSSTIMYEDILYANFGRVTNIDPMYRPVANREFMDILQIFYSATDAYGRPKHLFLTARSSNVWMPDDKGNKKPSHIWKPEGCSKIGYFIQNKLELQAVPSNPAERKAFKGRMDSATMKAARRLKVSDTYDYVCNINMCLRRPSIAGVAGIGAMIDDEISYPNFMQMAYPDMPMDEWV